MKPLAVDPGQQALIDMLLAGKAVGSGRSRYSGMANFNFNTREDIEKSKDVAYWMSDGNYFKDQTIRTFRSYVRSPDCDPRSPFHCSIALAQGMPMWFGPVVSSDPEEAAFIKSLADRADACARNASKKCLTENAPYAKDLDNYGPPRTQRALGKLLQFCQDMRKEANAYVATNVEEEGIRKAFLKPVMETLPIQLYSDLKKQYEVCPGNAYACANYDEVFLPSFPDPEKDLYVFIHELAHILDEYSISAKTPGTKTIGCPDGSHDTWWHKNCLFLSKMAKHVLARRGILDYKSIMRPWEGYHACFEGPRLDDV
jgi:hypothetical protein